MIVNTEKSGPFTLQLIAVPDVLMARVEGADRPISMTHLVLRARANGACLALVQYTGFLGEHPSEFMQFEDGLAYAQLKEEALFKAAEATSRIRKQVS
jgi:hypothetical protein